MKSKVTIKISGMDCSACVMNVDGVLEDIEGVEESRTSFAKEVTTVVFYTNKVSPHELISCIKATGYKAVIVE